MPNRIIKESIHTSDSLNKLTDFQFRLWVGLLTYVDDYGRGDARPAIIKGAVFPLRERISLRDIDTALKALAGAGCVSLYEVDGKPYLYFPTWESHQNIRNKKSKFPAPPTLVSNLQTIASNCNQLQANVPVIQSESESESESEVEVESEARARKVSAPAAPADDRIIAFDGTDITEDIQRHDLAEQMVRQYNVNTSEPTLTALIEDLSMYGEERMREVLNTAALSDTRGKVTVQYWRAILNGNGKSRGKPPDGGAYLHRQYSDADFRAMEVDLDNEIEGVT